MIRSIFLLGICISLLSSCNYFNIKKEKSFIIAQEKIRELKNSGLDLYPEIYDCADKNGKQCFEKQLLNELKNSLENLEFKFENSIDSDTIFIHTLVENQGNIKLQKIKNVSNQKIYSILKQQIDSLFLLLSPIKPAILRDVNVASSYQIPLILKHSNGK